MNKAIYIATSEENSGKSVITLGLMSMLMSRTSKVGYYRPIVEDFEEVGAVVMARRLSFAMKPEVSRMPSGFACGDDGAK